jgi:hypothetical protein
MIRNGISQTMNPEDTRSSGRQERSWSDMTECSQYTQYLKDMHRENPTASVLICMGVGFGVGLVLANVLEGPTRRLFHQDHRNMAERIGSQVMDSISDFLPRSLFGKS